MPLGEQYIALYQAFHQFHDAHTYFSMATLNDRTLPIVFERINQSFIVVNATAEYRALIGQTISKIEGEPIELWYQRAYQLTAADNQHGHSRAAVDLLHRQLVYALYDDVVCDKLLFEIDASDRLLGFVKNLPLEQLLNNEQNYLSLGSNTLLLFALAEQSPFGYWQDDDKKIITIYFNSLSAASDKMVKFGETLRALIERYPDYYIALDFRSCLGGSVAALSTIFGIDYLEQISDRTVSYVSRNSMSAGTLLPGQLRRLFGIKIIGELTPYSEKTAAVSASADKYRIASLGAIVSSSFSNGGYQERLAQPTLVPDYLIEVQLDDYTGRRDIWQDTLIDLLGQ